MKPRNLLTPSIMEKTAITNGHLTRSDQELVRDIDDNDIDSDDDDDMHQHLNHSSLSANCNSSPILYLLGLSYHPVHDHTLRREDESQHLTWFTYRCEFEEIIPYGIRSDAGWGCMFRSMQMLFGQALKLHYCGRSWKWPRSLSHRRQDSFVKSFLTWFADFPSVSLWNEGRNADSFIHKVKSGLHSWYSLHNMVAVGLSKYQVLPGEWLGPGSASYIIRDLCERHYHIWKLLCKQNEEYENVVHRPNDARNPDSHKPPPRVYVVQEGCIYRPMVEKLMTNDSTSTSYNHSRAFETKDNPDAPISIQERNDDEHSKYHPLDRKKTKAMYDPLTPMLDSGTNRLDINAPWDTSLLLLIPLRLGLKSFNVDYSISLASTFQLPQSVGFVGGSPRHALWFYGALSNGSKLYGLDPHTVQHAPSCFFPSPQATGYDPMVCHIDLTDEYLRTVQFPAASSALDFSKIDPSLALGFLCRDRVDFSAFCDAISRINASSKSPELFTISDLNSPCYGMDVDSMADDPLSSILDDEDRRKSSDIPVEDDEYVLL